MAPIITIVFLLLTILPTTGIASSDILKVSREGYEITLQGAQVGEPTHPFPNYVSIQSGQVDVVRGEEKIDQLRERIQILSKAVPIDPAETEYWSDLEQVVRCVIDNGNSFKVPVKPLNDVPIPKDQIGTDRAFEILKQRQVTGYQRCAEHPHYYYNFEEGRIETAEVPYLFDLNLSVDIYDDPLKNPVQDFFRLKVEKNRKRYLNELASVHFKTTSETEQLQGYLKWCEEKGIDFELDFDTLFAMLHNLHPLSLQVRAIIQQKKNGKCVDYSLHLFFGAHVPIYEEIGQSPWWSLTKAGTPKWDEKVIPLRSYCSK